MTAEGISSKVRRIAILVTSLDASAGRQLLMAMPTELARQVRRAMTQLGHVDPEEQRQILDEFRMQAMTASDPSASQLSHGAPPTSPAQAVISSTSPSNPSVAPSSERSAFSSHGPRGFGSVPVGNLTTPEPTGRGVGLSSLEVATLSELLRGERATVVAVVLSQLEPQRGAELLSKLPKPLQREAVVSLSRIGQIDPDAMAAIDEHLASRIADYHHRQAGESESTSRMQELLAAAAPDLRSDWQRSLYQAEPHMAARMGFAPPATASATSPADNRLAASAEPAEVAKQVVKDSSSSEPRRASRSANMLDLLADNVVTTADVGVARSLATPQDLASPHTASPHSSSKATQAAQQQLSSNDHAVESLDSRDDDRARILPFPTQRQAPTAERSIRFEQILDLPAEEIGQILANADTEVILYALAGASPAFMKRFMSMLDRADGRALQSRLKQLRAINLKDVDAAQRTLCDLATRQQLVKVAA